ncbi:MAG: DUF1289 domain-containing protein [Granulosicoccus sp.]
MSGTTASPCSGICTIDEYSKFCLGCQRTIKEIAQWGAMDDEQRLEVLNKCVERQQMPSRPGNSSSVEIMAAGVPGSASDA